MNTDIGDTAVRKLRAFYEENSWARPFFDWAGNRQNDAAETNLDRICQKSGIDYDSAKRLAEAIDAINVGSYVVGRKGHKTRIQWKYSLKSIGAAARGASLRLNERSTDNEGEDDDTWGSENETDIEHRFRLRENRVISFVLPRDLTQREAERLSTFVQSLPFDE